MDSSSLVYPMFVMDGENDVQEIPSMYGQYRYTVDRMGEKLEELLDAGVSKVILFGIPSQKDEVGSQAYAEDGVVQRAFREAKTHYPEMYLIGDVCMCEYTSHGHCGILHGQEVDNDTTLDYLARIALSQVQAGADMVAPSDMMDGRVEAIRHLLDKHHYTNVPLMSYAVKFASAYYGPFRDAADSAPQFGNRKSYQMDFHNRREAVKEALADIKEGADIIMVKPAMIYGDLIREIKDKTTVPMATYSVSGEYAMIKGAAKLGLIDEDAVICETAVAAYRAGADIYLTYFAKELAGFMKEGRIG
jgi:porphobilinogen synthase